MLCQARKDSYKRGSACRRFALWGAILLFFCHSIASAATIESGPLSGDAGQSLLLGQNGPRKEAHHRHFSELHVYEGLAVESTPDVFGYYVLQEENWELERGKMYRVRLIGFRDGAWPMLNDRMYIEITPPGRKALLLGLPVAGYDYPMELYSFVSPHKREIFISAQTGGMSFANNDCIVEVVDGKATLLYGTNVDYAPKGQYLDDYRVEIRINEILVYDGTYADYFPEVRYIDDSRLRSHISNAAARALLDVSGRKEPCSDIYDENSGKLISGDKIHRTIGGRLMGVTPSDVDGDGIEELVGEVMCRRVSGVDELAIYRFVLKYKDGRWQRVGWKFMPVEGVKLISMTEAEGERY
jgi:hypothetical protein